MQKTLVLLFTIFLFSAAYAQTPYINTVGGTDKLADVVRLSWNDWEDALSGDWYSIDGKNKKIYSLHNQQLQGLVAKPTYIQVFQNESGYFLASEISKPLLYFRNAAPGYIEWSSDGEKYLMYKNKATLANSRKILITEVPQHLKQDLFSSTAYVGGLYNGGVIYDKKIWHYKHIRYNGNEYIIAAQQGKLQTTFALKAASAAGFIYIKKGSAPFRKFSTNAETVKFTPDATMPKSNAHQVWIKGIVKDYAAYADQFEFVRFPVDDPILGKQATYSAKVNPEGYFETNFPLSFAQDIMMTLGEQSMSNLFVYPGDTVLLSLSAQHIINYKAGGILLIGHSAGITREIEKYNIETEDIDTEDEDRKHITEDSAMSYLQYRTKAYEKQLQELNRFADREQISQQGKQFLTTKLNYSLYNDLLRFSWLKSYYTTGKSRMQELPDEYLKLITNEILNNPGALQTSNYTSSFLHEYNYYHKEAAYSENSLKSILKKWKQDGWSALSQKQKDWIGPHSPSRFFYSVSQEDLKKMSPSFASEFDAIKLTKPENLSAAQVALLSHVLREAGFDVTFSAADLLPHLKLQEQYGQGLAFNLLLARELSSRILNDVQADSAVIAKSLKAFTHKTVRERVTLDFNKAIAFLKNPEVPKGSNLHDVAGNAGDSLLHVIAQQFAGKVLYLDFWATWCSPCLAEMKYSPELKKALEGKDVVFVYLCSQSSEAAWKQRINQYNIQGEHYFLNNQQWEYLRNKFQITGVPHYVLVNKNGEVVNPDAKRPSQVLELRQEIGELLR